MEVVPTTALRAPTEDRAQLLDPAHEQDFRTRGFAVLDLLGPTEVEDLREAWAGQRAAEDDGLAIDYMRPDRSHMRAVAELTAPLWERHLGAAFTDHVPVFATFVTKYPGDSSEMFFHEDRSFVDERVERAGTLWIPLVDVGPDIDNGGLELVPGSHVLATTLAGSNTPEAFRPFEDRLRAGLVPVALRAGQAVYYDTRTLHRSGPNRTSEPRPALVCAIVRRGSRLIHVVGTGRRHRQLYDVSPDFFIDHHPRDIERLMPAVAELAEEWDEEPADIADLVAELLGLPERPAPGVLVPPDVSSAVGLGPVAHASTSAVGPAMDRDVDPGDLPTPIARAAWPAEVGRCAGPVSVATIHPASGDQGWEPRSGAVSGGGQLVWMGAGSRLELVVPDGDVLLVHIVDAPVLGAGIACQAALQLAPRDVLRLAGAGPATVWNDGPGLLVFVLGHARGDR